MEKRIYTVNDVIIEQVLLDNKYNTKGYRQWHKCVTYKIPSPENSKISIAQITISDMFGGCGAQQIYDWLTAKNKPEIKLCLEKLIKDLSKGVGFIICQVGMTHYDTLFTKALDELGFEITKEYENKQHMKGYTQRLYTLTIK